MKPCTRWLERTLLGVAAALASLAAREWGGLEERAVVEAFYVPLFCAVESVLAQRWSRPGNGVAALAGAVSSALFAAAGLGSMALEASGPLALLPWLAAGWLSGGVVRRLDGPGSSAPQAPPPEER